MLDPRAIATLGVGYGPRAIAALGLLELTPGDARDFLFGEFAAADLRYTVLLHGASWADLRVRIDADPVLRCAVPAGALLRPHYDPVAELCAGQITLT